MIEIKINKDFNLKDTVTCGQIFRYDIEIDNSYTIILSDRVINVYMDNNTLKISSNDEKNLKDVVTNYFDLNTNYDEINNYLISKDKRMKKFIDDSKGLKIIRQEPFEALLGFIISANNNVKAIARSLNLMADSYGKKVIFNDKSYSLFPLPKEFKNVTKEELRKTGIGFRDNYLIELISAINNDDLLLDNIASSNTEDAFSILQEYKGIGPKVASCVLLFSYQKYDVFPIDVWVKRIMKEEYNLETEKKIRDFTTKTFGKYSGIAIQYMFHSRRNKTN